MKKYLIVIACIIRGELVGLDDPISDFEIIDESAPDRTPGNRHSLLLYKNIKASSAEEAIKYIQNLSNWRYHLKYDPYLRDGYVKSGHMLLHSVDKNGAIWSERQDYEDINYVFDGVSSDNETYKEKYGIEIWA